MVKLKTSYIIASNLMERTSCIVAR